MSASLFGRGARTTPSRILDLQENSHEHCSNLIIQMVLQSSNCGIIIRLVGDFTYLLRVSHNAVFNHNHRS